MSRTARVRKLSLMLFLFMASLGVTTKALASGDSGCATVWRLLHHDYEGCGNMAFLAPSNDTRVNLLLMMTDLRMAASSAAPKANSTPSSDGPLFLWEQLINRLGSQADKLALKSSDTGTQHDPVPCPGTLPPDDPFSQALRKDNQLTQEQRDALLHAREQTQSGCAAAAAASALDGAQKVTRGTPSQAYALYLEDAAAFWQSDYDKAASGFTSLTDAQPAWVRETATSMIGRSLINRAQVGVFDEYGSFKEGWHTDAKTATEAEAAFDKYLQQYPEGAYAQSARGLKRRGYWLAQDTGRLEEAYGALLMLPPEGRGISDVELAQEIDNKVTTPPGTYGSTRDSASEDDLLKVTQNPLLLAMLDLRAMRTTDTKVGQDSGLTHDNPISIARLQQQRPYFAAQMPLYDYLLAVHAFYLENKPADVLRILPDAARQSSFNYLQFSRQVLRGMALEALKDHNALDFWTQMLPGAKAFYERPALELAIAYHEERAGETRNVFAPASPVHYPYLREVLLANVADAGLLRTQAKNTSAPQRERDFALFTLLFKEATRGEALDFLKDLAMVPANAPTEGTYALDDNTESYFDPDENRPPAAIPLGIFLHGGTEPQFNCPGLRASQEQLAQDPNSPTARLCIADFVRLSPSVAYLLAPISNPDELGGTPSLFLAATTCA